MEITVPDLIKQLNDATKAYDEGHPIMSDKEWDNLYFALLKYEAEGGIVFPDSPTQKVNYEVVNKLNKVEHNHPMLSLEKTKSLEELNSFFANGHEWIAMCKMDGLTCSLRYENGELVAAETRGNGIVGEDILHNVKHMPSVPKHIDCKENFNVDGEIICKYDDFVQFAEEYKNPRNFAAGSIRLLNSKESAARKLTFVAWSWEDQLYLGKLSSKLDYLKSLGFTTVPYVKSDIIDENLISIVKTQAYYNNYPIDGVVFKFDDIPYGRSLGMTDHHFKNAIAYKFYDETYETTLTGIDWTMGRTGVLTPVATFEPIDIDGSVVERASLHNVSVMEDTLHGVGWLGQKVWIYKANQIIPQIEKAEEDDEFTKNYFEMPHFCPVCGSPVSEVQSNDTRQLVCSNPACQGKLINKLDHFCGKKGLDIKGLSKATLEKLIDWNWVASFTDIFKLSDYKEEWIKKPGFGLKSVNNILNAIEAARTVDLDKFICALGIPLIGKTASKEICKHISSYQEFRDLVNSKFDFGKYEDFAESKTVALWNYNYTDADDVFNCVHIATPTAETAQSQLLEGKNIVITGKLTHFKNRAELQSLIEQNGGKVVGTVSKNTTLLINNDATSSSAKNTAAKKLGIPIFTEEQFLEAYFDKI